MGSNRLMGSATQTAKHIRFARGGPRARDQRNGMMGPWLMERLPPPTCHCRPHTNRITSVASTRGIAQAGYASEQKVGANGTALTRKHLRVRFAAAMHRTRAVGTALPGWCEREDLNLHGFYPTGT